VAPPAPAAPAKPAVAEAAAPPKAAAPMAKPEPAPAGLPAKPVAKPAAAPADKNANDKGAGASPRKLSVEVAPVKGKEPIKEVDKAGRKGGLPDHSGDRSTDPSGGQGSVPPSSRVLTFFVTLLSLTVLGGVGYVIWVMFSAMGNGDAR
jgi:hypothetical protein